MIRSHFLPAPVIAAFFLSLISIGEAQNPFESDTEDPFASPEQQEAENPFQTEESTPDISPFQPDQDVEPDNPFAAPPAQPESDSPFGESGGTSIAPPSDNPFDAPGDSPFTAPDAPRQVAPPPVNQAPSVNQRGRLPQRLELQYVDPALRRAAEIRGLYTRGAGEGIQSVSQIQQLVNDIENGDFNRVYIEVRTVQGLSFESQLEASFPFINAAFTNPVELLRESLNEEIGMIAVADVMAAHNAALGSRPPAGNPAQRFPQFVTSNPQGETISNENLIYLDPGIAEVREYLSALFYEIETETSPRGYLLEEFRYPGSEWGYNELAVEQFRREVGGEGPPPPNDPVWSAWRRSRLDLLLVELRETIELVSPDTRIAVSIEVNGPPPETYEEYLQSTPYREYMQDWIGWCRRELIDEIVFVIHERIEPQGNVLREWIPFINSNVGNVRPVISLAGDQNFRRGLNTQYSFVRERAIGTLLHHYTDPARDFSRGFYPSLDETIFRGSPGRPISDDQLAYRPENRNFRIMNPPPPVFLVSTPTPAADQNPLSGREIVFTTPTPIPTPTPLPNMIPNQILRTITLVSGKEIEVTVLEANARYVTIESENTPPVQLSRRVIDSIEPPL